MVQLWSVGFMGADSRAGEEQREELTSDFRNDSTFIVSGSFGPVRTWGEVAVCGGGAVLVYRGGEQ
jgi:hypothetical protein